MIDKILPCKNDLQFNILINAAAKLYLGADLVNNIFMVYHQWCETWYYWCIMAFYDCIRSGNDINDSSCDQL